MSISDLFDSEQKVGGVISKKSLSDMTSSYTLQSHGILSASYEKYDLLLPNIDFSKPENFVKYGSAEKYYSASIYRIANTFPYDGSRREKLNWRNSSSYLDNYLFDKEYPKNTGSITIGTTFGTASVLSNGYYSTPARVEYIKIGPGLSTGTTYDTTVDRQHAFSFNSENGFCVEFFMKANTRSPDIYSCTQIVLDMGVREDDLTSSTAFASTQAYRFWIGITGTTILTAIDDSDAGEQSVGKADAFSLDEWARFSINVFSGGIVDIWKNGQNIINNNQLGITWPRIPVVMTLSGTIGAYSSIPNTDAYVAGARIGWNKFSGSLDDFKFWRRARTDKEIASQWFHSTDGGYETDSELDPDMGWYYKFNEWTTATSSYDATVLDYSGRKNNGYWIGYVSGSRSSTGAMDHEEMDPIQHTLNERVYSFITNKLATGSHYDINNNGAIVNNLPSFILDEDANQHYENLTQIIASMFDRLFLQIQSLTSLKDSSYFTSGSLSSDIMLKLINSNGLRLDSILTDYDIKESIQQKTDNFMYQNDIERIKEVIYKNIYNNMIYIFKSKGTDKAIKSVFRAFGVDDDVLKIKSYTKEGAIEIDGSKRKDTVRRKNMLDLYGSSHTQSMDGVVVSAFIPNQSASMAYLTTSLSTTAKTTETSNKSLECTILFPTKYQLYDPNHVFLNQNQLSASLFGFYEIDQSTVTSSTDFTWQTGGYKFRTFAVQKDRFTKDAKFVFEISGSTFNTIYTETMFYPDVYDNSKWTFAFRTYHSSTKNSGLMAPDFAASPHRNTSSIEICGYREEAGLLIESFSFVKDIFYTGTNGIPDNKQWLLGQKTKVYLGANRTNFTGTVLYPSQAKFLNLRYWDNVISDDDIKNHAKDAHNFGIHSASRNWKSYANGVWQNQPREFIPNEASLLVNWDFENNYTPDQYGIFTVSSISSASKFTTLPGSNEELRVVGRTYSAIGYGFASGSTVIDKNYVIEQKNRVPTDYYGYDDISLVDDSELYFGRQIRPIEYFYTIENSIYDVISEDILNFFSSIDEFNNLFGYVVEKYRTEYKLLRLFRNIFFSKINNTTIDIDKYISYYKWLDDAISSIVAKLLPLSANADANIRNVIESHVLERNKYLWTSEIIRQKISDAIEGTVKPIHKKFIVRS